MAIKTSTILGKIGRRFRMNKFIIVLLISILLCLPAYAEWKYNPQLFDNDLDYYWGETTLNALYLRLDGTNVMAAPINWGTGGLSDPTQGAADGWKLQFYNNAGLYYGIGIGANEMWFEGATGLTYTFSINATDEYTFNATGFNATNNNITTSATVQAEHLYTTDDLQVADDILLGSGSVINWNSGDILLTHSSNSLSYSGMTTFGLGTANCSTSGYFYASSSSAYGGLNYAGYGVYGLKASGSGAGSFTDGVNNIYVCTGTYGIQFSSSSSGYGWYGSNSSGFGAGIIYGPSMAGYFYKSPYYAYLAAPAYALTAGDGTGTFVVGDGTYSGKFTGRDVALLEDTRKLVMGAAGSTDYYQQYSGSLAQFYAVGGFQFTGNVGINTASTSSIGLEVTTSGSDVTRYGVKSSVNGGTTGYNFYANSNAATTKWFAYNATMGGSLFGVDNVKTYWGSGVTADSYIQYTGSLMDYYSVGGFNFTAATSGGFTINALGDSAGDTLLKVLDSENGVGYWAISEGTSTANQFLPTFDCRPYGIRGYGATFQARYDSENPAGSQDLVGPGIIFQAYLSSGAHTVSNVDIATFRNYGTELVDIQADGDLRVLTGDFYVLNDSKKIVLGAAGTADSYLQYTGSLLDIYAVGGVSMSSPLVVVGNSITLGDGSAGDPRITFDSGNDGYIEWQEDELQHYFSSGVEIASWLNMGGAFFPRQVTDAGPMTATDGTEGEIVYNLADDKFYGATVTGTPATWAAFN